MSVETVPDEENPMLLKPRKERDADESDGGLFSFMNIPIPEREMGEIEKEMKMGRKNIFEWYQDMKIKPFIFAEDLNNSKDEPDKEKSKMVYGFGLKFKI